MASEREKQKEELAALVVHDLKNPLTSIMANASFLLDEPDLSETAREAVEDMLDGAESMHRMVENLLDIGRGEEGALLAQPVEVDLAVLVEDVMRRMRRRAGERGQRIELQVSPRPLVARVDPELGRRLVENLLEHGLKSGPVGDVLGVELERLEGGAVELRMREGGDTVPPEQREKLFDKYGRLEQGRVTLGGRGLGLVFCRLAAEVHGGRIWVEPETPRGNCFHVRIGAASMP